MATSAFPVTSAMSATGNRAAVQAKSRQARNGPKSRRKATPKLPMGSKIVAMSRVKGA